MLGVEGARTLESIPWTPWVGILAGLESLDVGDDAATESWYGWVVRVSAGVPFAWEPWNLEFGLFASVELGGWSDRELDAGGGTTSLAVGQPLHGAPIAGLRIASLP